MVAILRAMSTQQSRELLVRSALGVVVGYHVENECCACCRGIRNGRLRGEWEGKLNAPERLRLCVRELAEAAGEFDDLAAG